MSIMVRDGETIGIGVDAEVVRAPLEDVKQVIDAACRAFRHTVAEAIVREHVGTDQCASHMVMERWLSGTTEPDDRDIALAWDACLYSYIRAGRMEEWDTESAPIEDEFYAKDIAFLKAIPEVAIP
jgi:hypothetical protein